MRGSARWFWFVLALALHMPVSEAQERISSSEFSEWQAFYHIEPFGDQRADLRSGIISSTIASVFSGDSGADISPADFMPLVGDEKTHQPVPRNSPESPEPGSSQETRQFLEAMGAVKAGVKEGSTNGEPG